MNISDESYYKDILCLRPIEPSNPNSLLCCKERLHTGTCESSPKLYIIDSTLFPEQHDLEVALAAFIEFMQNYIENSQSKSLTIAAITFDFIAFTCMLNKPKYFTVWDESLDNLRKIIYGHVMYTASELTKLNLKLFNNNKELLCPVLGRKFNVEDFIQILTSPQTFIKPNTLLSSEVNTSYTGPLFIPISSHGMRIVSTLPLYNNAENENWRTILREIVQFQDSIQL